jgi:hemolysin III
MSVSQALAQPETAKPLMRGWLHAGACLAALATIPRLLGGSGHDPVRLAAMGAFGLAMVLLYAVSALYHIGDWRQPVKRLLARLDYANIFLFMAASHTALCVLVLPSERYLPRLALIWLLGLIGIGCVVALPCLRRRVRTSLYVLVGWAGALSAPVLQPALATPALFLISGSAVVYLLGGAIYAWQRPNPLPAVFGFHELFHLLTIVANAALAAAFWIWLLPAGGTPA